MREMNFACKSCRRRGVSRERRAWSPAVGQRGVTTGNESHNASNARSVTAGKMGRNSCII